MHVQIGSNGMSTTGSDFTSDQEGVPAGAEAWDDWEEEESEGFKSLFSEVRFASLEEVLQHDEQQHGFSLRQCRAQHGPDQVGTIRLINFIRASVAEGHDPRPLLAGAATEAAEAGWHEDDRYLQPALMNDELLFHDWEGEDEAAGQQQGLASGGGSSSTALAAVPQQQGGVEAAAAAEAWQLRQENEALRGMLEALRAVVLQQDEGMRELIAEQEAEQGRVQAQDAAGTSAAGAAAAGAVDQQESQGKGVVDEAAKRIDDSYFDSYSTFDIHREMLGDKVRTEAYRQALEQNPGLMRGATVLDVGCGTGILSMFAARGGAAAVVGIDGSDQIAKFARSNVEANGLAAAQGGPITVVSSKVEQLAGLPLQAAGQQQGQQQHSRAMPSSDSSSSGTIARGRDERVVDVLVSEWMGYALLFESMLDSVLHARDRWLRPGGAVLPDIAQIYVAAAGEGATGLDFWRDVYGFSMEAVRASLEADALKRAVVRAVSPQHIISEPLLVRSLDLATMAPEDQDFTAPFRLTVGAGPQHCHALVLWFDMLFSERFCQEHPVVLSTSPAGPQTHWVQTVLLLKQPVLMAPAAVAAGSASQPPAVALRGQLSMCRSKQTHRSLDIVLRYAPQYADGSSGEEQVVLYGMGVET